MPQPCTNYDSRLRKHFSRLSNDALKISAAHFCKAKGKNFKGDEQNFALVEINCKEVTSQGVDELFTHLLADVPEYKRELLELLKISEAELIAKIKEDLLGYIQALGEPPRSVLMKVLDVGENTPKAICEQLYINGLDAFFSQLATHKKLDMIAAEYGISANADDAVERIIDQIFPPPGAAEEPAQDEEIVQQETQAAPKEIQQAVPAPTSVPAEPEERVSHSENTMRIRSTRPPLQKGITLDDIQNMYWVDELKAFCKEHNIKCAAKKAAINRAVYNFLNTGELPKPPPAKRKGTRGTPKRKKPKGGAATEKDGHANDENDSDAQEDADDAEDDASH